LCINTQTHSVSLSLFLPFSLLLLQAPPHPTYLTPALSSSLPLSFSLAPHPSRALALIRTLTLLRARAVSRALSRRCALSRMYTLSRPLFRALSLALVRALSHALSLARTLSHSRALSLYIIAEWTCIRLLNGRVVRDTRRFPLLCLFSRPISPQVLVGVSAITGDLF